MIEDDQKFLKDVDTARVIAQLGYRLVGQLWPYMYFDLLLLLRSSGKTLSEEEFQQLKEEIAVSRSFGKARKEVFKTKTHSGPIIAVSHVEEVPSWKYLMFQFLLCQRVLARLANCLKHSFYNWLFPNQHHLVQS